MKYDNLHGSEQADLDAVVVHALERRPEIALPTDFAARVVRSLPIKTHSKEDVSPEFGRVAGYLALVAVMAALLVLSWVHPEAMQTGRGPMFSVELLLVGQLLAVGLWLGLRDDRA